MNFSTSQSWYDEPAFSNEGVYDLRDSSWSRDLALWLVAGYIGMFIVRPWEVLMPWLGEIRFERNYAIVMILVVLATGRRRIPSFQCWTVLGFTTAVAVSASFAWQPGLYSWEPLYRFTTVAITYFLIVAVCRAPRDLFFLIKAYVSVMWVYLAKAIWEYAIHGRHEYAQSVSRLIGIEMTFGDSNAVAMSTVVSLPMWWFLFRRRDALTFGWGRLWRHGYKTMIFTYPLLALVAVLLTNSRAGMVFLAVFVALLVFSTRKNLLRTSFFLCFIFFLLWLSMPQEQKQRLETLWNPNAGPSNARASAEGRWAGFVAGMTMWHRYPVTGVGVGNFLPYRISHIDGVGLIAHNLPGEILGEMGTLGGITFFFLVYAIWWNCRKVVNQEELDVDFHSTHASLVELAKAITTTVILMLLFGLSLHNGLRFNWIWIAAFAFLTKAFFFNLSDDAHLDEHQYDTND